MSYHQSDIDLLKESIGSNFDFTPATATVSDATSGPFDTDAKTPDLSDLKRERLGVSDAGSFLSDSHTESNDDLMHRFASSDEASQPQVSDRTVSPNRVYLKRPLRQSDTTEAFAPKPVVISGTTGKVTERG